VTTKTAQVDIAQFYYEQRHALAENAPVLRALIAAINAEYDLARTQWAQWYTIALGFRPDLVVELGRAKGNSTALFTEAASRLGGSTRVVSLCNSTDWAEESLPRVRSIVPPGWLDRLDARRVDILDVDYEQLLEGAGRVLLLWDAHGFDIAETVLGRILPAIANRPHLVLMHDISDNRYAALSRSYEGQPLWKGSTWEKGVGRSAGRVNIGWMSSLQDQVVAIADFAWRNSLEIGSADHDYVQFFGRCPERADEMKRVVGDEFFSTAAHFAYLTIDTDHRPLHYPAVARQLRCQCDVAVRDIHPSRWLPRRQRWPRTIETAPVPWQYAAVMECEPSGTVPAGASPVLRVRVEVSNGPVGVGILNTDQSKFTDSRRVLPAAGQQSIFLSITRESRVPLTLVFHAWDEPVAGRVCVENLTCLW
jgi:hypothetical protein